MSEVPRRPAEPAQHRERETPAPRAEYERRRAERNTEATRLGVRERLLSHARLAVFFGGVIAAWLAFGTRTIPGPWVLPFVLGFIALAVWHDRTIRAREGADRAVAWYQRGLARIDDRWADLSVEKSAAESGASGERFRDATHPYADDLDLFGKGSIFELLCCARTPMGEETLAAWLREAATPDEVGVRQQAVEALRHELDLREDLAAHADEATSRLAPEALVRWGSAPASSPPAVLRLFPALATLLTLGALAAWIAGAQPPLVFVVALAVQGVVALALRSHLQHAREGLDGATRSLDALSALLQRIQDQGFEDPRLAALRAELASAEHSAASEIAALHRLAELLDARRNQLFLPIAALLCWGTQLGMAIEGWRARCGPRLERWLEAVGEIEALCSLSAYAYEHPDACFPIVDDAAAAHFDAEGLGHPLIPAATRAVNDIRLDGDASICIVSGSNMSGKSTWLRAIGVAAAMAQAGAPVCARALRLSPLAVGASLRIVDSLQTGTSHFYAEIQRLRQIVDLADGDDGADGVATARPLLFLLDEILHGTNSHDRRIGAEAIVKGLLGRGALGLVTTHDLALARIGDDLAPRVRNLHFADHLEDGELRFDYRLREGVVERSNALALMRAVGLDV